MRILTINLCMIMVSICTNLVHSAELDHISPSNEAVVVGQAGSDPADISRYLMASGAGETRLSPDGNTIAFAYSVTGAPQLWIMPVNGRGMRQLTFGNGVTFFRWSPDGENLLYGSDNNGNEQESYSLISVDGLEEKEVLPPVSGGFRSFGAFSANGRTVYFASTHRNGLDFDIYSADLDTGESTLLKEGKYGNFVRAVSPDGRYLVIAETVGEDSDNLYLLDTRSRELATLSQPEERANHSGAGIQWLKDGSGFYLASNLFSEFASLMFFDLETSQFRTIEQSSFDVENVTVCGKNDDYLAWTSNEDGFHRLSVLNLNTENHLTIPQLPEGIYSLSCGAESNSIAVRSNGWKTPGDIHLWDLATDEFSQVFESNLAGLDASRLIRPQSIRMTASDGVVLQGLLYLPDADSTVNGAAPPVVFEVHGGPSGQSRANFDAVSQYHADRGVAVFKPNVRGSTGFGRTYVTLDDRTNRLDSVRDLVDMLAFFEQDGRVDAERAAVSGGSYGGYMVNAVLAAYPGSFKAGVSRYSVADWVTALEVASPALKASDLIEYGDINLPEWRSFYEVNSPIRQAHQIDVPVLFSHGAMDPRINIAETETMVSALRENNVDAQYIRIPDEGHGWRKMSNRLFYYRRQAEFLESQLLD